MRKHHLFLAALTLLILFSSQAFQQQRKLTKPNAGRSPRLVDSGPIPVVHGSSADGLPDQMTVRGLITKLTFAEAECGFIAWAGTLRIKLHNRIDRYPHDDVFVLVTCFLDSVGSENKYLNKTVSLEVEKLYGKKDGSCYFEIATNRIDSKGIPFYCAGLGKDEILKVIERENAHK